VGLHPHDAAEWTAARGEALLALAAHPRVVALGEMGLDFHYDHSPRDTQRAVLRWQVQAGRRLGLPLIVHDRETGGETFRILLEEGGFSGPSLVYHCFSGTVGEMEEIVAAGGYISIPGIVTFKKSDEMREVARRVPLDRLLIETDSPFLAPVPHRGRKNEPAFVRHVAECIAGLRGMDTAALAAATTANAFRFFRLPAVG
jgi:TatD DNase family protein